jgi:hypothetical protein
MLRKHDARRKRKGLVLHNSQALLEIRLSPINATDKNHVTNDIAQGGAREHDRGNEPAKTPISILLRLWHNIMNGLKWLFEA